MPRAPGGSPRSSRDNPTCALSRIVETGENIDAAAKQVFAALRDNPAIRSIYHASVGAVGIVNTPEALGRDSEVM